jgi:hypothetical protein
VSPCSNIVIDCPDSGFSLFYSFYVGDFYNSIFIQADCHLLPNLYLLIPRCVICADGIISKVRNISWTVCSYLAN